jgi:hypothetical protein
MPGATQHVRERCLADVPVPAAAFASADCPIPTVLYPPEQYSTASLITIFAPLPAKIPRQECREQATNLAVCALDGSLGVKSGCCSTSCSAAMAQVLNNAMGAVTTAACYLHLSSIHIK